MGAANEQIRISDRVKRELERRKREHESYTDVLERMLDDTVTDFDDGFGIRSDEQADRLREERETMAENDGSECDGVAAIGRTFGVTVVSTDSDLTHSETNYFDGVSAHRYSREDAGSAIVSLAIPTPRTE